MRESSEVAPRLESHGKWIERWADVERPYSAKDVVGLRGTLKIEYTLARLGAQRLWRLLHTEPYIRALGAQTGAQAVQMVQAGLKAIYVSGWQVAGDMNTAGQTYPDQSLYPVDSVPNLVRRINNALQRADEITQSTRACRPDAPLARAPRRRRRSGLRRRAQRLRVDEGHDRGRGRRGALRGPALLVEEMRSHGRQGAGAHPGGHRQARGGAAGGRRAGRADA